ncbi:hypothetical protein HRbin17_02159 [bacterium HR17]|jgi:uncharacterized protein with HEPN domain|uniref:DUF86 domain-containing protein n=1 Tax=Candidatus Fervidibacter japonicus TaxID=2035412 RepID=A0A2H5XEM4_9BACT|nr:hypothetical protein HRbin17_02159 [bacterium HR17]
MKRTYTLFLKDILEAMEKIEQFTGETSFDEFVQDDMRASAVVRKLEIIGEAAKNIPSAVRRRYPDVPWSSMARMRDRLTHGYWAVDYEIVWKVIRAELPALKPRIQEIYRKELKHDG